MAFSPDGRLLATAGHDRIIRIWAIPNGQLVGNLEGHRDWISHVAFSPDGKFIASASRDWTVRLWEVAARKEVRRFDSHQGGVLRVSFSLDGRRLSSAGQDKQIKVLDLSSKAIIAQFSGFQDWVISVAFSPDGRRLAACSRDGSLRILSIEPRGDILNVKGLGRLSGLAWLPGRNRVVCLSQRRGLIELDPDSARISPIPLAIGSGAQCMAVSTDGKLAAVGYRNAVIRVWDLGLGMEYCPRGHALHVPVSLQFSPDGRQIASGGRGRGALLWPTRDSLESPRSGSYAPGDLDHLWLLLAGSDAPQANRSIWLLSRAPAQSVPLIKRRLQPLRGEMEQLDRLIRDLDDPRFAVRQKASDQLQKYGTLAEYPLQRLLAGKAALETRQRARQILDRLRNEEDSPRQADLVRCERAVTVLERAGTAEAHKLLTELADGDQQTWLADQARSALKRLPAGPSKAGKASAR